VLLPAVVSLNLLLAVVVGQAAPAGPAGPAQPRTVEISAGDAMRYSLPRIPAKAGETLRLVLTVSSKMPKTVMAHNLVVLAKGVNAARFNTAASMARDSEYIPLDRKGEMIAHTGLAGGGERVEVTFTVPSQAGTYAFICTFPGHFNLGMKGELVVK
jgi:azurin